MKFISICKLCQTPHSTIAALMESRMGQSAAAFRGEPGTTRIVIPVNISGEALRLVFHNADSLPGELTRVTLAKCDAQGHIETGGVQEVVHDLSLAPGAQVYTAPIAFSLYAGEYLAVSVYCRSFQFSMAGIDPMMLESPAGDFCGENFESVDRTPTALKAQGQRHYPQIPLLSGVEVYTASNPRVVVCLGDSITQQGHWFTVLQKRLYKEYPGGAVLLNAGITGNRLLRDCAPRLGGLFGDAGVNRLRRDVLEVPGVSHMILALGVNDIMHADGKMAMVDPAPVPTPEAFFQACREIVRQTAERGIAVTALTLYPARLSEKAEKRKEFQTLRREMNAAIEAVGFAHVLHTEEILGTKDGEDYRPGLCRPDYLHLNEAGGEVLGKAFPLEWCVNE